MTCYKCDLNITRTNVVLGVGKRTAEIMLISDTPDYTEDKKGVPLIGKAGVYIRDLLNIRGYNESNMFITNVVKCRPPKNRTPDNLEISTCTKFFLFNEIVTVNPIFIITMGAVATSVLMGKPVIMKDYVDKYFKVGRRWVLPIYHPSYILQNEDMSDYYAESIDNIHTNIKYINHTYLFDILSDYNNKI